MRIFGKIGGEVCFVGGGLRRGWGDVNVASWTDIWVGLVRAQRTG